MNEKMNFSQISTSTIRRLPKYYQYAKAMQQKKITFVSSDQIGEDLNITPSQLRQDIGRLGNLGVKGIGYSVEKLVKGLESALGVAESCKVILVGAGKIGCALLESFRFEEAGCRICAAFDTDPQKCGRSVGGVPVFDMERMDEVVTICKPDIAVLAVPAMQAQAAADLLVKRNVRNFWNITNRELTFEQHGIHVQNLRIAENLLLLTCAIRNDCWDKCVSG